jgi:hypothetical protein
VPRSGEGAIRVPLIALPPRAWVINRRHFNKVLRFAEAIGALGHLESAIAHAARPPADGLVIEVEIYPHEHFNLELLSYVADDEQANGRVTLLGGVVLRFDSSAIVIVKNPWTDS